MQIKGALQRAKGPLIGAGVTLAIGGGVLTAAIVANAQDGPETPEPTPSVSESATPTPTPTPTPAPTETTSPTPEPAVTEAAPAVEAPAQPAAEAPAADPQPAAPAPAEPAPTDYSGVTVNGQIPGTDESPVADTSSGYSDENGNWVSTP